ncbi:SseB family protein [Plantactinospora siamensis]|uniref:SseB family protein n=1 Tax=Plantactinospora siamensis TaxID=555372 RepID=A0ABV6NVT3_9ACTN
MTEWEPATEAEAALREALREDDQERYFLVLARMELLLPVPDGDRGHSAGWGTWTADGRTHVLAFTSTSAAVACLGEHAGPTRRVRYGELAASWPSQHWWLAVNPGLPIEGYLPAWFVVQLARGDVRLPGRAANRSDGADANRPGPAEPQRSEPQRSEPQRSGPQRSEPQRSGPQRSGAQRSGAQRSGAQWSGGPRPESHRSGGPGGEQPSPAAQSWPAARPGGRGPAPAGESGSRPAAAAPVAEVAPTAARPDFPTRTADSWAADSLRAAMSRGNGNGATRPHSQPLRPAPQPFRPAGAPFGPPPPSFAPGEPAAVDHAPFPDNHVPARSGPAPAPADRAPAPAGHVPALAERAPVPAEHAPVPANHAPVPANHAPVPANHAPAPANHAAGLVDHAPGSANHAPALVDHAPAPAKHLPIADDHVLVTRAPEPAATASAPEPAATASAPEPAATAVGEPLVARSVPSSMESAPRAADPAPVIEAGPMDAAPTGFWRPAADSLGERAGPAQQEGSRADDPVLDRTRSAAAPLEPDMAPAERDRTAAASVEPDLSAAASVEPDRSAAALVEPTEVTEPPWSDESMAQIPAERPAGDRPVIIDGALVEPAEPVSPDARLGGATQAADDPAVWRAEPAAPAGATGDEPPSGEPVGAASSEAIAGPTEAASPVPVAVSRTDLAGGARAAIPPESAGVPDPAAGPDPGTAAGPDPGTAAGDDRAIGDPAATAEFVPANEVEESLYDAAVAGSTDDFLSTLLLARVLLPVDALSASGAGPGDPGFRWRSEPLGEDRFVVVFTSPERFTEYLPPDTPTATVSFVQLIRRWPDPSWSFAVNPGTPVGAKLPGDQVLALANWANDAGLEDEPATTVAEDRGSEAPVAAPAAPEPAAAPVLMQKAVAPSQVGYYLERGYDRVAGFVQRASEVAHLRAPAELYGALGLRHPGSPFDSGADEIYLLRWPAYRPDLYRIPYGGRTEEARRAMQGWMIERPPFRGNGFAPGDGTDVIAEFKVDSVRLPHGAQLVRLGADGAERLVATLDADRLGWVAAAAE